MLLLKKDKASAYTQMKGPLGKTFIGLSALDSALLSFPIPVKKWLLKKIQSLHETKLKPDSTRCSKITLVTIQEINLAPVNILVFFSQTFVQIDICLQLFDFRFRFKFVTEKLTTKTF